MSSPAVTDCADISWNEQTALSTYTEVEGALSGSMTLFHTIVFHSMKSKYPLIFHDNINLIYAFTALLSGLKLFIRIIRMFTPRKLGIRVRGLKIYLITFTSGKEWTESFKKILPIETRNMSNFRSTPIFLFAVFTAILASPFRILGVTSAHWLLIDLSGKTFPIYNLSGYP